MNSKEWKEVTLGDVCVLNYGKALTAKNRIDGDIPVFSSAGITGCHNSPLVESEGIIVGRKGSVGTVYYSASPFFCIDTAYYVLPNEDYNLKYLFYRLKSLGLENLNEDSAVPGLNRDTAYSQRFLLPPYDEQLRIADTLSSLDDKIELNNSINMSLEEIAQAIFKSWFEDFEPFLDGEFEDSELGRIPKGWRVGTLGDIAMISSGKRPLVKQDNLSEEMFVPVVGASCIMAYTKEALYDEKILVTGRVGTHGVIQRFSTPCWASDNTLVIKSEKYEFVYQILKNVDFKSMNRGSTQPLITQTDLKNVKIIIPPDTTLKDYESLIGRLMEVWQENNKQNYILTIIRDTLLPKLMSGEIRVAIEEVQ